VDSGRTHRKQRQPSALDQLNDQVRNQQQESGALSGLEESSEFTVDRAAQLQAPLGNQAIMGLLDRLDAASMSLGALEEDEEYEEAEEILLEEDHDLEADMEMRQLGGDGSDAGVPSGDNPWNMSMLFGGEDDPLDPRPKKKRTRRRSKPEFDSHPDEPVEDKAIEADDSDPTPIDDVLGEPETGSSDRWGDNIYEAVEAALLDDHKLRTRTMDIDSIMQHGDGSLSPIVRPAHIARFLFSFDAKQGLCEALLGPAPSLLIEPSGYAGAAARLANIAVCAQSEFGGQKKSDRAVSLALSDGVWDIAVNAAKHAAREGKLHAPYIAALALGEDVSLPSPQVRLPKPSPMGGRALEKILPENFIPPVPNLALLRSIEPPPQDPDLAAADAVLAQFTEAVAVDTGPVRITLEALRPVLLSANALMNSMGRVQVELAAAAIAVRRLNQNAPVRSVLTHADLALRELARGVIRAGKRLETLNGQVLDEVDERVLTSITILRTSRDAVQALRLWAFATIAGSLNAISREGSAP